MRPREYPHKPYTAIKQRPWATARTRFIICFHAFDSETHKIQMLDIPARKQNLT